MTLNHENFLRVIQRDGFSYVQNLYDNDTLTRSNIQDIIDLQINFLQCESLHMLQKYVINLITKDSDKYAVNAMFDHIQGMFNPWKSEYRRLELFTEAGVYIKPQPFVIGHGLVADKDGILDPTNFCGQYVPMGQTLKSYLEIPGVLQIILDYMNKLENDNSTFIENIIQGSLWREKIKPLFPNKTVLPIEVYADDYDSKGISPKAGVNKLYGVYFRLPCIPPEFQAQLSNIFTSAIVYSEDKAFGISNVYRKTLEDLKKLETDGIEIVLTDKSKIRIYFAMILFTGDNLAVNEALGLVTSFSGNYWCRTCRARKDVAQKLTEVDETLLRNRTNYDSDLQQSKEAGAPAFGIKNDCIWHELKSFHLTENLCYDLEHDLNEGVHKYVMIGIIGILIARKRFTYEELNNRIAHFAYGSAEISNKPSYISKNHIKNKSLHLSACQMICLVRYFGLIMGDCIKPDEDRDVWRMWTLTVEITNTLYAPYIDLETLPLLSHLISEQISLYIELFDSHPPPKLHFQTHIPDAIKRVGPLVHLACLKYERNNKLYKGYVNETNNYRNLPQTLLKRHQMRFAFKLLAERGLQRMITYGKTNKTLIHNLKSYNEFRCIIPRGFSEIDVIKFVKIGGTRYAAEMVVTLTLINDLPVFGKIAFIVLAPNDLINVYFIGKRLIATKFDEFYQAYQVRESSTWFFVTYDQLLSTCPSHVRSGRGGAKFITHRYSL